MTVTAASTSGGLAATVSTALAETGASLKAVFASRNLRRIQLAFAGSIVGDWAYATAVTVWAYGVGGAKAVGIWTAVRLLTMALTAPRAAGLADKLPRKAVMVGADLTRAVLVVAATACLMVGTPAAPVFVLAALVSLLGSVFRPAQAALLPALVDGPEQLTASNGASSTIESIGFFLGPALGALLLGVGSVETVFLLNAATFVWSAALVLGVRPRPPERSGQSSGEPAAESADPGGGDERHHMLAEMSAGFTTIARNADLGVIAVLVCAQTVVAGASAVFAVVLAVDVLDSGPEGVGVVNAAFGAGAIVGGFVALARASRNRLAADLATGTLLWSLPLLLVVWQPLPAVALAAMLLLGLGNPLVDVSFYTIVQRIAPDQVLGRVFGAMEGLLIGAMAVGAAVMPLALDLLGFRGALVLIALVAGVPTLLLLPTTRRMDARLRPPAGLELLRSIPLFAPLGPAKLESLARQLERVVLPAGYVVLREGADSDRFYVIEAGGVEVAHAGHVLRREGAGEFFGEIGLLHDVPRTADVTTTEPTVFLTLGRAEFLAAMAGTEEGRRAAEDVIARRLSA